MVAISSVFDERISEELQRQADIYLLSELKFDSADVSFFDHFPALTLTVTDLELGAGTPFRGEHLIKAERLALGVNVFKLLFRGTVEIDKLILSRGDIQLKTDRFGRENFDVIRPLEPVDRDSAQSGGSGSPFHIRRLVIDNSRVLYEDRETGYAIETMGLNYRGKGGLKDAQIRLGSRFEVDSVDVTIDQVDYLKGKRFSARSITVYDTESISVELNENDISVNDLDFSIQGRLDIFEDGLFYDFIMNTRKGELSDVVSILPPQYEDWSRNMRIQGDLSARWILKGFSGIVPDSLAVNENALDLKIEKGRIRQQGVDHDLENLHVDFEGLVRNGQWDLVLDSLYFELDREVTSGQFRLGGRADSLSLRSHFVSRLDLDVLDQTLELPGLRLGGALESEWRSEGVYQPERSRFPKTHGIFTVRNGFLATRGFDVPLEEIEIDGRLNNPGADYTKAELDLQRLDFSFGGNPFHAKAIVRNFDRPEYDIESSGSIDLTGLNRLIDLPIRLRSGSLKTEFALRGRIEPDREPGADSEHQRNEGTISLTGVTMESDELPLPVIIREGTFWFQNERMAFDRLKLEYGESRLDLKGYFEDYFTYALSARGTFKGKMDLDSEFLWVDEFIPSKEVLATDSTTSETGVSVERVERVAERVIPVPDYLDLDIGVAVDSLVYKNLHISSLSGNLALREGALLLRNGRLEMADGTARVEGYYKPVDPQQALFSLKLKGRRMDIEKTYGSLDVFRELAPAAEKASGLISLDYDLEGVLDPELFPKLPSLKGGGVVTADNLRFRGYKLLSGISGESGYSELDDAELSGIRMRSTIENHIMNIERFKFKVRPLRLRMEGQTTLDGVMAFRLRIGLPPFGLIGVPVKIEGPADDYTIKIGRKTQDLEELEFIPGSSDDELRRRMSILRDSIKEGMTLDEIELLQERIQRIDLDSLQRVQDSIAPVPTGLDTIPVHTQKADSLFNRN